MVRLYRMVMVLGLLIGVLQAGSVRAAGQQAPLPPGWKQVTWEGVITSFDPRSYIFAPSKPDDPRARTQATVTASPHPCTARAANCSPVAARFQLFPSSGMDVRAWVARNYASLANRYTDIIIADRQAVEYIENASIASARVTFVVPVGTEMLVVDGPLSRELAPHLQFSRSASTTLAVGQPAITSPGRTWDLWTDVAGGTRAFERPRLYGGTLLTIIAMTPRAVMVRTSDDVTGWIRASASSALITNVLTPGERGRFEGNSVVQVELRSGVPIRQSPRSTAPKLLEQLAFGQQALLLGVRGDWAQVMYVDDARRAQTGWARWYYDGTRYLSFSVH